MEGEVNDAYLYCASLGYLSFNAASEASVQASAKRSQRSIILLENAEGKVNDAYLYCASLGYLSFKAASEASVQASAKRSQRSIILLENAPRALLRRIPILQQVEKCSESMEKGFNMHIGNESLNLF